MEWSLLHQASGGFWELLDSHRPQDANGVHSYTKSIKHDALYRLKLQASYEDGTCCLRGLGWFTITESTRFHDYAKRTVVWKATGGDILKSSLNVSLWIDDKGHAQQMAYVPGKGYTVIQNESDTGREPMTVVAEVDSQEQRYQQ